MTAGVREGLSDLPFDNGWFLCLIQKHRIIHYQEFFYLTFTDRVLKTMAHGLADDGFLIEKQTQNRFIIKGRGFSASDNDKDI